MSLRGAGCFGVIKYRSLTKHLEVKLFAQSIPSGKRSLEPRERQSHAAWSGGVRCGFSSFKGWRGRPFALEQRSQEPPQTHLLQGSEWVKDEGGEVVPCFSAEAPLFPGSASIKLSPQASAPWWQLLFPRSARSLSSPHPPHQAVVPRVRTNKTI